MAIKMSKEDKQAVRETRREIKLERRYGSAVMAAIVKLDPAVKPYYDKYKRYKQQETHAITWALFFVALATLHLFLFLLDQEEAVAYGASADMMIAMFWLCNARIEEARADLVRHELVQYADDEAVMDLAVTFNLAKLAKGNKEVKNGAHTQAERNGRGHRSGLGEHSHDGADGASR